MRKYLPLAFLFALLIGGLSPLMGQPLTRFQQLNNSPDPTYSDVYFWVDLTSGWNDWFQENMYKEGSSFSYLTLIKGVAVSPVGGSINDTLVSLSFAETDSNIAQYSIFTGVSNPLLFATNPDGINTGPHVTYIDYARESSLNGSDVDVMFFHGVTDAPTIDIRETGGSIPLANDLSYTENSQYVSLPPASYQIEITNSDQTQILYTYTLDLSTFGGESMIVYSTGFVDPLANSNGPDFGLCYLTAAGDTGCFQEFVVGIEEEIEETGFSISPSPANGQITIGCDVSDFFNAKIEILDISGAVLLTGRVSNSEETIDISNLANGIYFAKIDNEEQISVKKFIVNK